MQKQVMQLQHMWWIHFQTHAYDVTERWDDVSAACSGAGFGHERQQTSSFSVHSVKYPHESKRPECFKNYKASLTYPSGASSEGDKIFILLRLTIKTWREEGKEETKYRRKNGEEGEERENSVRETAPLHHGCATLNKYFEVQVWGAASCFRSATLQRRTKSQFTTWGVFLGL